MSPELWATIAIFVLVQIGGAALSYGSLRGLMQGRRESDLHFRDDVFRRLVELETRSERRDAELTQEWREMRQQMHAVRTSLTHLEYAAKMREQNSKLGGGA